MPPGLGLGPAEVPERTSLYFAAVEYAPKEHPRQASCIPGAPRAIQPPRVAAQRWPGGVA